jgi:hypothetical protein
MLKVIRFVAGIIAVSMPVFAQTNSEAIKLRFVTNAPPSFFWKPTPEQKKIEGVVFQSTFNEFDSEVRHSVVNMPENGTGILTLLTRIWGPAKNEFHLVIKRTEDLLKLEEKFDADGTLQFLVDGQRWTFTNNMAGAIFEKTSEDRLRTSLYAFVSEPFVRALGSCQRAAMRVPQKVGNFDYNFSKIELSRFNLFVRAYLSNGTNTNRIKINPH